MSISTDAMYNAESRYLHKKYIIHFSADKTLEVTKSDYLISSNIYEEAFKLSNSPFGDVTSNELELVLYNTDNIFSPKNEDSPYHGFIRRGIQIEAFIRPDEVDEWDKIGVYYVNDWNTASSGFTAVITAYDKMYSILNAPVPSLKVARDIDFAQFIADYFALFNVSVYVDTAIVLTIPYAFTSGYTDNRKLLADLMIAAQADCFCNHSGDAVIKSKTAKRDIRATFTDNDQIVTAAIKQSLSTDYDSASITYNAMQESQEMSILSVSDLSVAPGITDIGLTKFSAEKVLSVKSIKTTSNVPVKPIAFEATADSIAYSLQSTSDAVAQIDIIGTVLEKVSSIVSTDGAAAIELDSQFVQTKSLAESLCEYVDSYVDAAMPTLELVVRGNPKIELGDLIQVDSSKYKLKYTGTVAKAEYGYDGGLTCKMTLVVLM